MGKVFIKTFGCQSNKSDSERLLGDYQARGFSETGDWRDADEIVINTCSVRQSAEDRVRGLLLNIDTYFSKNKQPRPKVILTGCMLHFSKEEIKDILPSIDEILPINEVGFNQKAIRKDKVHAYVQISTGCNSFCTYCIVPYSRGREKSRNMDDIISEVKELASQGYKTITLLGQNVNSYGLEKTGIGLRKLYMEASISPSAIPSNESQYEKPKSTPPFVELLRKISLIDGIENISFFTSNPWDFWDELIDEIAVNKKIDRFIHLPIQSGSNHVLKLMNRGYTRESYLKLIDKIKAKIPEAVFGTDIIVGFPGETESDFLETVDLVKKINFPVAFVARYSPRPGTVSSKLYPDEIPASVKKARWEILDKIINKDNLSKRPTIH